MEDFDNRKLKLSDIEKKKRKRGWPGIESAFL